MAEDDEVARARELILKRRSKLMAAAMTGLGVMSTSCSKTSVCLSIALPDPDGGMADAGGGPSVCLGAPCDVPECGYDAGPTVCLEPLPPDDDAGPTVCLDIALPDDAGPEDAGVDGGDGSVPDASGPTVCLGTPWEEDEADEPGEPVAT